MVRHLKHAWRFHISNKLHALTKAFELHFSSILHSHIAALYVCTDEAVIIEDLYNLFLWVPCQSAYDGYSCSALHAELDFLDVISVHYFPNEPAYVLLPFVLLLHVDLLHPLMLAAPP